MGIIDLTYRGKGLEQISRGDSCSGLTKKGQLIIGIFVQAAEPGFCYIRGVAAENGLASPFKPAQIFKITRKSLRKK